MVKVIKEKFVVIGKRRIHSNHGKMALAKAYIWQVWNVLIMQKHLMDGQNG